MLFCYYSKGENRMSLKTKKPILKVMSILLSFTIIQGILFNAYGATVNMPGYSVDEVIQNVSHHLIEDNAVNPWSVAGLARSEKATEEYYKKYYENLENTLKEKDGILNERKYTEYSSAVIALTAIGKDPSNVAGYNILEKLANYDKVVYQGINGAIWALIALDTGEYNVPAAENIKNLTTRQGLIEFILNRELDGGGWSMGEAKPDPDVTAMVLQSFSEYQHMEEVKAATERALNVLSAIQNKDGGYESWGTENSESAAQVLIALCALGIDPEKDLRFVKGDGNWLVSNLINNFYKQSEDGFMHIKSSNVDELATNQGFYALVAYKRFVSGKTSVYDMNDVHKKYDYNSYVEPMADMKSSLAQIAALCGTIGLNRGEISIMLYRISEMLN
jgi:hypothetical protein